MTLLFIFHAFKFCNKTFHLNFLIKYPVTQHFINVSVLQKEHRTTAKEITACDGEIRLYSDVGGFENIRSESVCD